MESQSWFVPRPSLHIIVVCLRRVLPSIRLLVHTYSSSVEYENWTSEHVSEISTVLGRVVRLN